MKKIYYSLLIVLGLSLNSESMAQSTNRTAITKLDKIVAVVNTDIITQSEFNHALEQAKKQLEHSSTVPPDKELRKQVLDQLIGKTLQMQLVKAKNIQMSDADVDKAIENIAKNNHLTLPQLKEALVQTGSNYTDFRKKVYDQGILQHLQEQEVARTVTITPEEVKAFLQTNKGKNQYSAFHLVDVLLPLPENATPAQKTQLEKQANIISAKLQQGNNVDDVVNQYKLEKNDLGWRSMPEIPSLFQAKVVEMKVKSTSNPIQAPNGLHILKLIDAKGSNIELTEREAQDLVFQQKMGKAVNEWVQKLRSEAYIKIMN